MCWNAEISLNTFIFAIFSMIMVIMLNKVEFKIILFVFSVSLMQLLEYYTWNNINNKEIIFKLSIIGFFLTIISNSNIKLWIIK